MLKGWWAGKTKARLAAKASGAIGKLSKEVCSLQYGRVVPLCAPHVDVARGDRLGSVEGTHTEPPGPIPVSKKGGGGR